MPCIYCKKGTSLNPCRDCEFDPDVMISKSEAKRKFKLTDTDLNKAKLYCITFETRLYSGTKYILLDILNLADSLTKNLDQSDKRRLAYLKQKQIVDNAQAIQQNKITNSQNIKNYLTTIIEKSNFGPTAHKIITSNKEIDEHIHTYLTDDHIDIAAVSLKLIPVVENIIKKQLQLESRIIQMDNLIKNKFGTISYVEILSNFPDYQHYLFQNTDLNQSFERIEEHLNMKLFVGDRQKKLNALIDGHFVLKKDIVEAKKHKLYQGFVEFNRGELNDVFHVIRTHVEKVNDCAKKSQKFNRELNKIVPVKYRALMVADPLCVNFHKHPVENFDDILDAIKAKIDLISKKEAFDKILMSKQLGPTEPYYTAYLQGLASKEETITNISSIPSNYLTLPEFTKYKNQLNKPDMQDTQLIDDTIFEFCNGSDDQLILEGFDGVERTYIHGLCDKLKLNHSKIKGRRNKDITISGKPFKKAMKFMDTATYYKKIDN